MECEDPKDMTASDLLRHVGCKIRNSGYCRDSTDGIDMLRETFDVKAHPTSYCIDLANSLCFVADKIDAELAQARKEAVKKSKKPMWWFRSAISRGEDWPAPQDGDTFRHYLERCFIPRPRYEDGEPVQFGDDTDKLDGVEQFIFLRSGGGCCQMQDADGNISTVFHGERVKRPAPEALGADGKPIVVGETVYDIYGGDSIVVKSISRDSDGNPLVRGESNEIAMPHILTHTPPDTQERIDKDALKSSHMYWGCENDCCSECPALIDGKTPLEFYNLNPLHESCIEAQKLDLLRRQRELDKRTGGAE